MADIEEQGPRLERSPSYDSLFGDDVSESLDLEESGRLASPLSPSLLPRPAPARIGDRGVVAIAAGPDNPQASPSDAAPASPACPGGPPACRPTWVKNGFSLYPTWTVEPTIQSIVATLNRAIGFNHEYEVQFLHEGALSKLYDVSFNSQAFVMRICLPVCPQTKTESEVATLGWVKQHTPLPVPHVRAYDSSRNNPLGYEWLLMTKLEGKPLSECWSSVTIGSKERLVRQIAAFVASTFNQPFREGIGSLFKATPNADGYGYSIGKSVSMAFF